MEPALGSDARADTIPVFKCLCFSEKSVHAYDDLVALQRPLEGHSLRGGVLGRLLLSWLTSVTAKEVEVSPSGQGVLLKAGRARLETSTLPEEAFLFKPPPKDEAATTYKLDEHFAAALAQAAISLGRDPQEPWRLGVTAVFGREGGLVFYASDNLTAVRVVVADVPKGAPAVVLPPRFVELFQGLAKEGPQRLRLHPAWVQASFSSGLRLFSRAVGEANPGRHRKLFAGLDARPGAADPAPLPKGLQHALDRAATVTPYTKEPFTKITTDPKNRRVNLLTRSSAGDVRDAVAWSDKHELPQLEIEVVPSTLARGLAHADKMSLYEDCVALHGPGFTYVAAIVRRDAAPAEGEPQEEEKE